MHRRAEVNILNSAALDEVDRVGGHMRHFPLIVDLILVSLGLLVFNKVRSVRKGLTAGLTLVWFFPRVNTNVRLEPERVGKKLVANVTLMFPLGGLVPSITAVLARRSVALDLVD